MLRRCSLSSALALALVAVPARAQNPAISPTLFSFPGTFTTPPSARSAALALADRWLGDEPFDNAAAAPPHALTFSGLLVSTSRQDLRGQNRDYDEQPAFLDIAGAAYATRAGAVSIALYASQPGLRLEDNAFTAGSQPSAQPAAVESSTDSREQRAGLAVGFGAADWRVGAAVEWTRRDDRYETTVTSGSPFSGVTLVEFSGSGVGGQLGVRGRIGAGGPGTVELGAGARFLPELAIDGEQTADLVAGFTTTPLAATRSASWEGGLGIRVAASPAFKVMLSLGGHGAQEWQGFGVTRGAGSEWKLGGEYHDERDPWSVRFAGGFEEEQGVPEPRASVLGLGGSWLLDSTTLDLGVAHRRLQRPGQPDSGDDRVVLSIVQSF